MTSKLNEHNLLQILQEIRKLGENNDHITSKDIVLEIEKMILLNETSNV